MGEAPRRTVLGLPPGDIPVRSLTSGTFVNPPSPIAQDLPYLNLINVDTSTRTFILAPRQIDQEHAPISIQLLVGAIVAMPTAPFGSIAVDSSATLGAVGWFYSDVPASGPRGAAGSAPPIIFPSGAKLIDDGAGGMIFEGSDYTGSAPNLFQSWHFRHNGLLFGGDGNNVQIDPSTGLVSVYGTLVTQARGFWSVIGPTSLQPTDAGVQFLPSATHGNITFTGPNFHPQPTAPKTLLMRITGHLSIKTANGGTWTPTVSYVSVNGDTLTDVPLPMIRDSSGAGVITAAAAGEFEILYTFLAQAAVNGSQAITCKIVVTGSGGSSISGAELLMEWADAE